MAKLIYSAIMSLDGYIEDQNGKFDWAVPMRRSTGSSTAWNERPAPHLYRRRMSRRWRVRDTQVSLQAPWGSSSIAESSQFPASPTAPPTPCF